MPAHVDKFEMARAIHKMEHIMHSQFCCRIHNDVDPTVLFELTPPQFNTIMAVREAGSVTIKQLAQILKVKAPSASTMVDRLVETGVLTREENPADRREVLVRISPEMSVRIEQVERVVLLSLVETLDRLGPKYARMWHEVAIQLIEMERPNAVKATSALPQKPCAKPG